MPAAAAGPSTPCFETWTPDGDLRKPVNRLTHMLSSANLLGKLSPFSILKVCAQALVCLHHGLVYLECCKELISQPGWSGRSWQEP